LACRPLPPDLERSATEYDKAPLARGFVFSALAKRLASPAMMPVMVVPMVAAPMMPMPMAVMPAPVTVMPTVVAPMVAVPMLAPADLLRLQSIDLGLRDQGRLRGLHPRRHDLHRSGRRQRRGIGHADQRRSSRDHSDRELQNRPKFHAIFSFRARLNQ
jgi:hypothetical protein